MSPLRVIALVAAAVLAGCGGSGDEGSDARTVVASFYPLAYAVEQIGGSDVDVTNLTPAGVEPHDLELTARDVQRIREADVVLYLDEGFQPAVEDAVEGADGVVVDLLRGLPLRVPEGHDEHADEEAEHETETSDPHVWLDPVLYARIARRIGEELGREEQANAFAERLESLDRELSRTLRSCRKREFVTSHAAFGYLAARYGLEQVPIAGVSPEAEPTPRALKEVVEHVREVDATTIFFETLVSPRVAETVAREVGARTAVLNPLEGLDDTEIARGDDYFSVMRANADALRKALECR
jgi:zinc transport system substrate-binding protein